MLDEAKINALLEKRAGLIHDAREIHDKAETEGRDATAEEKKQFDTMMDDADTIHGNVEDEKRLAAAETDLETSRGRQAEIENPEGRLATEPQRIELRKSINGESRDVLIQPADMATGEIKRAFRNFLISGVSAELRDLTKGTDSEGGYLSAPLEFMAELIKAMDDMTFMREICRVLPPLMEASTLGAPTIDTDMSDPTWTTELLTGDEDSDLAFGRRDLTPQALAKWIKVSKTLLRRSTMSADTIVRDRLAYVFAITQENGFLNGAGTTEPLGVFTADAAGVPTSRDEQADNTTTAFTGDGLVNAFYKVKAQYRGRASWIFHRDAVKMARKLKSTDDQYLWQPGLRANEVDTLLGAPVRESEYAPNTFTADKYVGIIGDFSQYWIVDALTLSIQVLVELYAATNQNAYLGRLETDGQPVDPLAFCRVQLASA